MKNNKRIELTDHCADIHDDPQFLEGEVGIMIKEHNPTKRSSNKIRPHYLTVTYTQMPGNDCYDSGIFDI